MLCRGPNLRHSAKSWQRLALGKEVFAEGRVAQTGPRQIWRVGPRRPRPVRLCRGLAFRPSVKFFLNQFFGKVFSISFFFYFLYIVFAEGQRRGPRQRPPLPRAQGLALGKDFFSFFKPSFFGNIIHCFKLNFKIWANFDYFYIFS